MPSMLPMGVGQRAAFTAIVADQQIRTSDRQQELVVAETVKAVAIVAAKPARQKELTAQDLATLPTLSRIFAREGVGPNLRAQIEGIGNLPQDEIEELATQAADLIVLALPQGTKLTQANLKTNDLGKRILADPNLKPLVT